VASFLSYSVREKLNKSWRLGGIVQRQKGGLGRIVKEESLLLTEQSNIEILALKRKAAS
jgi:hypothetical protein